MSQQQSLGSQGGTPGVPDIQFLRGNDGVAVPPDPVTFIIDLLGDTAQGVSVDNTAPNTETITVQDATAADLAINADKGVSSYNDRDFVVVNGFVSLADSLYDEGQTIGAVTDDVITFNLGATPGTFALEGRVAGFEATTPAGAAFQVFATVRTNGTTATLVGIPDIVSNTEAAVNTSLADVIVSGNNAIIQVTGVALLTIDWSADLDYTFRG